MTILTYTWLIYEKYSILKKIDTTPARSINA